MARAGASKWREAVTMIEQNRKRSLKVVCGVQSRQQNTDSLKVEPKRVRHLKANFTRSRGANDVLEIQEPEPFSREDERHTSPIPEGEVTENSLKQDLRTREEHKAPRMDCRSSAAWMIAGLNLIGEGRLLSRASYSTRDWSRDTARGTGSSQMDGTGTTTDAIVGLQSRLLRGITTDSSSYIKILHMCLQQKDLSAVKQVHDCITKSGMNKNPYVAGTLLNVYIKCGGLLDARRVFVELEKRTVVHWNSMIAGYAKSGNADSAFQLFKLMRQEGPPPNNVTYLCILKAFASPPTLKWGKEVHGCIRQGGFESDVRVGSALLQMYAKCGCITEAKLIFEKLINRNIITWNIMIGALAESGRAEEAYRLLLQMSREGFQPDAFTYASILNATASAVCLEWVKKVHADALKAGLDVDLRVANALVHMYAKSGSIDDARQVFDRMEKRSVVTWNIMIGGHAESGHGMEAYALFLQMIREGFEPNAMTYASILNATASAGALDWVKKVHGRALKAGLESDLLVGSALVHMYAKSGSLNDARLVFDSMGKRNLITWNTMIGAYAESGHGVEAYELFLGMRQEGFEPDVVTFASILNASASAGALEWLEKVHGHVLKAGLESDLRVANALVHRYAKSGSIDAAKQVFNRMEKRDVITWNIMIGAHADSGRGMEAYELFLQMRREGFEPDAVTYVSMLNASASEGALEWVNKIHGHALKAGLTSDLRVGNAFVHMYAKSGSIDDAQNVFHSMETRDVITWNTIIGGLAQHGLRNEAYRLLVRMRHDGFEPNAITYVSILNASGSAGSLEWVKKVQGHALKAGLESDQRVGNALIHMYAKSGRIEEAQQFFDRMGKRDVMTWNIMIGAHAERGSGMEAYGLFLQMIREGFEPNPMTYGSILNASASAGALDWVRKVHGHALRAGLESDLVVGSALVHMYAKSGSLDDARLVFDRMEKRNVITWNTMIGAHTESGLGMGAYALFLQMRGEGFEPDVVTYASIFNASASASASAGVLEWVKKVHGHALKAGLEVDLRVANALVHMYVKSGSIDDAKLVFDRMGKRDVVTWNIMIGAHADSGRGMEAYELFRRMTGEGFEPDAVTFLSILNASASAGASEWVKEVHGDALKAGLESDLRVGNALVHMYAKTGNIDEAQRFFERMGKRDIITWNIMIGGLAQRECGLEAYRLFLQMRRDGFEPNAITYVSILNAPASAGALEWVKEVHGHAGNAGLDTDLRVGNSLIHMYAKSGSLDEAQKVFDRMGKRDVITWNILIGAHAESGRGMEAYELFLGMRREGFEPDAVTYANILNASASAGALEWVKKVHGHACKAGLESDLRVGNAAVHMYGKCGSIDDAQQVFNRMETRDIITWNTMIGCLAQHGHGHEVLELFRKMNVDQVKPNETSFVGVLSACSHGGLVDDGRRIFSAMNQDYGVERTVVHYNLMVDILGRAGHLEEAKQFIGEMPMEPDHVTWTALLGACRTYGNVELGEVAAKELFKLEPGKASTYVLLSNIYAAAGKWDKVSSVRTMMQERRVRKEQGRSWIEVNNKIHEFVVGDTSHPEAKAIYTELNKLSEKLKAEGYIPDTRLVLRDIKEEDKELALCSHSEKLAIAYGLMHIPMGEPIRVSKNLRVCSDCHLATKYISKITGREIIARDVNRFHHFKDGMCSCGDYW